MLHIAINFPWFRFSRGYKLAPSRSLWDLEDRIIVPCGGKRIPIGPLEKFDTLYSIFAKLKTPDELLDFINRYGLICCSDPFGHPVQSCLETARLFRNVLKLQGKSKAILASSFKSELRALAERKDAIVPRSQFAVEGLLKNEPELLKNLVKEPEEDCEPFEPSVRDVGEPPPLAIGKLYVVADRLNGVHLQTRAECLMDALWWQLVQKLSGGSSIRECPQCGEWFEAGPGTTRRSDATFCCRDHKIRYFSLKRSRK